MYTPIFIIFRLKLNKLLHVISTNKETKQQKLIYIFVLGQKYKLHYGPGGRSVELS